MMADEDPILRGQSCKNLLIKLKSTVQNLLANQSVQGVWGTYGGLRRVCQDTEAILCHRAREDQASSESDGRYWQFVQGLKWLSPGLAPVIERLLRHSTSEKLGRGEVGRAWLSESVQDYSLIPQLDILLANPEHLFNFYHDDAFLCQADYVQAMRICFKALELNKPALLSEINPQLLKQELSAHPRSNSLPLSGKSNAQSNPPQLSFPGREPKWPDKMGNKHGSGLEVSYSIEAFSSTQSLTFDPSSGFSSPGPQKDVNVSAHLRGMSSFFVGSASSSQSSLTQTLTPMERDEEKTLSKDRGSHSDASITSLDVPHTGSNSSFEDVTAEANKLRVSPGHVSIGVPATEQDDVSSSDSTFQLSQPTSRSSSTNTLSGIGSIAVDSGIPGGEKVHESSAAENLVKNQGAINIHEEDKQGKMSDSRRGSNVPTQLEVGYSNSSESKTLLNPNSENKSAILAARIPSVDYTVLTSPPAMTSPQPYFDFTGAAKSATPGPLSPISNDGLKLGSQKQSAFQYDKNLPLVRSDPDLLRNNPLSLSSTPVEKDKSFYHSTSPINSPNLSLGTSPTPLQESKSSSYRSSGLVYIPQPLTRGTSMEHGLYQPLSQAAPPQSGGANSARSNFPPSATATRKMGHKRWVSDTSVIKLTENVKPEDKEPRGATLPRQQQQHQGSQHQRQLSSSSTIVTGTSPGSIGKAEVEKPKASGLEPAKYLPHGPLTRPTEGQSLMSYLTSQDFHTCANLEKENAHFHISEALIAAFESMKWNRMMKKHLTGRHSSSSSSSDEEIQELRQRIRIRKQQKMIEKGRPFPQLSDGQTDTATTSQSASSLVSSPPDFSSMSDASDSEEDEEDEEQIDLTMSSDAKGNLLSLRSGQLSLSMASLYSEVEIQKSNQQLERNSSLEESGNPGSAESIAISLLRKFSEKHLPKASELKWLVSEHDAPQRLLPLPDSIPVSPDDGDDNTSIRNGQTRLRGNMEWAPPRAQIIFSIHSTEKRPVVMARQNYRCAGCGVKVDTAFIKRYRYCEYLGKYFCQCCHTGETSIIPGRVLEKWDFTRYPVSNFSYNLLVKMWSEPLFHIDTINPLLYKKFRALEGIREGRKQLHHLCSLLAVCRRDQKLIIEQNRLPPHWISNDNAYSMEDLIMARNGLMQQRIKNFVSLAIAHVDNCPLCQGLGFICGLCEDNQVIFPFQLATVVSCPRCRSCYHKECFDPQKCPKCIRLEARRRQRKEPEPLSPESPKSSLVESLPLPDITLTVEPPTVCTENR